MTPRIKSHQPKPSLARSRASRRSVPGGAPAPDRALAASGVSCVPAPVASPDLKPRYREVRGDSEVLTLISCADDYLKTIGYTDHGLSHLDRVTQRARGILEELGHPARECELAAIAGLLHDIGNLAHRRQHAQSSAILAYPILRRLGMRVEESARVVSAIANHDEDGGEPVSAVSAALILADKSDVLRSRVRDAAHLARDASGLAGDIHDRVNYAVTASRLVVDRERPIITLQLAVDTNVSPVMEYFEIFLSRMSLCRRAAGFLGRRFSLVMNETSLL